MALVWNPACAALEDLLKGGDSLSLLIAPYIKKEALERLIRSPKAFRNLRVIVRWRPGDLVAGVADLEVYKYLRSLGVPLYYNHAIHLKLFVFESNRCLAISANITQKGLGFVQNGNIEAGALVKLDLQDWKKIHCILAQSKIVDNRIYESLLQYVNATASPPQLPPFTWPEENPKTYTISSLPAAAGPAWLADFYFNPDSGKFTPEEVRRAAHDLALFDVPSGLTQTEFNQRLGERFCHTPFVTDFVEFLKAEKSLRFGAVTVWIQNKCDDVPLPYRWEIKEITRIFYDWLDHFIPEITWGRPNYSQVIYWCRETLTTPAVEAKDIDYYRREFCELTNRDRARNYERVAIGGAPHQPVLLLTVLDLYAKDSMRRNWIQIDDLLLALWDGYKNLIGIAPTASVAMPAYALRAASFWHLVPIPGARAAEGRIRNLDQLHEHFSGAKLDEELHSLLQHPAHRVSLREAIIKAYFPPEHWNLLNI